MSDSEYYKSELTGFRDDIAQDEDIYSEPDYSDDDSLDPQDDWDGNYADDPTPVGGSGGGGIIVMNTQRPRHITQTDDRNLNETRRRGHYDNTTLGDSIDHGDLSRNRTQAFNQPVQPIQRLSNVNLPPTTQRVGGSNPYATVANTVDRLEIDTRLNPLPVSEPYTGRDFMGEISKSNARDMARKQLERIDSHFAKSAKGSKRMAEYMEYVKTRPHKYWDDRYGDLMMVSNDRDDRIFTTFQNTVKNKLKIIKAKKEKWSNRHLDSLVFSNNRKANLMTKFAQTAKSKLPSNNKQDATSALAMDYDNENDSFTPSLHDYVGKLTGIAASNDQKLQLQYEEYDKRLKHVKERRAANVIGKGFRTSKERGAYNNNGGTDGSTYDLLKDAFEDDVQDTLQPLNNTLFGRQLQTRKNFDAKAAVEDNVLGYIANRQKQDTFHDVHPKEILGIADILYGPFDERKENWTDAEYESYLKRKREPGEDHLDFVKNVKDKTHEHEKRFPNEINDQWNNFGGKGYQYSRIADGDSNPYKDLLDRRPKKPKIDLTTLNGQKYTPPDNWFWKGVDRYKGFEIGKSRSIPWPKRDTVFSSSDSKFDWQNFWQTSVGFVPSVKQGQFKEMQLLQGKGNGKFLKLDMPGHVKSTKTIVKPLSFTTADKEFEDLDYFDNMDLTPYVGKLMPPPVSKDPPIPYFMDVVAPPVAARVSDPVPMVTLDSPSEAPLTARQQKILDKFKPKTLSIDSRDKSARPWTNTKFSSEVDKRTKANRRNVRLGLTDVILSYENMSDLNYPLPGTSAFNDLVERRDKGETVYPAPMVTDLVPSKKRKEMQLDLDGTVLSKSNVKTGQLTLTGLEQKEYDKPAKKSRLTHTVKEQKKMAEAAIKATANITSFMPVDNSNKASRAFDADNKRPNEYLDALQKHEDDPDAYAAPKPFVARVGDTAPFQSTRNDLLPPVKGYVAPDRMWELNPERVFTHVVGNKKYYLRGKQEAEFQIAWKNGTHANTDMQQVWSDYTLAGRRAAEITKTDQTIKKLAKKKTDLEEKHAYQLKWSDKSLGKVKESVHEQLVTAKKKDDDLFLDDLKKKKVVFEVKRAEGIDWNQDDFLFDLNRSEDRIDAKAKQNSGKNLAMTDLESRYAASILDSLPSKFKKRDNSKLKKPGNVPNMAYGTEGSATPITTSLMKLQKAKAAANLDRAILQSWDRSDDIMKPDYDRVPDKSYLNFVRKPIPTEGWKVDEFQNSYKNEKHKYNKYVVKKGKPNKVFRQTKL